jgi:hypothetical protein
MEKFMLNEVIQTHKDKGHMFLSHMWKIDPNTNASICIHRHTQAHTHTCTHTHICVKQVSNIGIVRGD